MEIDAVTGESITSFGTNGGDLREGPDAIPRRSTAFSRARPGSLREPHLARIGDRRRATSPPGDVRHDVMTGKQAW